MEILRKTKKAMLKIKKKHYNKMKNAFDGLINRVDIERVDLSSEDMSVEISKQHEKQREKD